MVVYTSNQKALKVKKNFKIIIINGCQKDSKDDIDIEITKSDVSDDEEKRISEGEISFLPL